MSSTITMREGKFKLKTFELTTPIDSKTIKLAPYCSRADIYESVLEPTVIAEFIIVDKIGIFNHFNFLEQHINIDFTTYEDNKNANIKYALYPISVDPAETLPDDKGIVYKITCVSREAIKSTQIKNIPLVRKKTESETIINALLQLVETDKNYFFENLDIKEPNKLDEIWEKFVEDGQETIEAHLEFTQTGYELVDDLQEIIENRESCGN